MKKSSGKAETFTLSKDRQHLTVQLHENPSTGYRWSFNMSPDDIIELRMDTYDQAPGKEGMVGAGGIHTWQFRPLQEGHTTLTFRYSRPWENGCGQQRCYDIIVDSDKQLTVIPQAEAASMSA